LNASAIFEIGYDYCSVTIGLLVLFVAVEYIILVLTIGLTVRTLKDIFLCVE